MVNSMMFYQIVSKIKRDMVFIVVGDDGQLPAIGAGDILSDILRFKLTNICKLTKIYRQNQNHAIATIANDIRVGELPVYDKKFDDFKFHDVSIADFYKQKASLSEFEFSVLRDKNTQDTLRVILDYAIAQKSSLDKLLKEKKIKEFLTNFQVISPMKGGVLGVNNLNNLLQNIFNPSRGGAVARYDSEFRLGDKVIHIKNENMKAKSITQYKDQNDEFIEKRVFNGQLGLIIKLNFQDSVAIVLYPNDDLVVYYDFAELRVLLSLAYSLTIHKTQGMEYQTAVIPMNFAHFIMHNTKLLYTAITRAKTMCIVVGEKLAFESACKRIENTKRETVIQDLSTN
jgi:exodeoxyribonuclease V alpha subunit